MTPATKLSAALKQHQNRKKPTGLVPLVAEDALYLDNHRPARQVPADFSDVGRRVQGFRVPCFADELFFARCFVFVWFSLPEQVRRDPLAYWRLAKVDEPLAVRPHIQIMDDELLGNFGGVCYANGHKLGFRASLTTAFRNILPFVIAHEIGHVHRHATGAFDRLLMDEVVEPFDEWERGYENEFSGDRRAKKLNDLRRRWRLLEEDETDRLAAQWRFRWPGQPRAVRPEKEMEYQGQRLRAYGDRHQPPPQPDEAFADDEGIIELPRSLTPLDQLPEEHSIHRAFAELGLDADTVGRCYGVSYCTLSDDPLAHGRVIIPIYLDRRIQGWQSMSVERPAEHHGRLRTKYLPALGMNRTRLVYNFDKARRYQTAIIVDEPTDVWSFGPMALCPVGERLAGDQVRRICKEFRNRRVVILLYNRDSTKGVNRHLRTALAQEMPGRVAFVTVPRHLPPGTKGRKQLRALTSRRKPRPKGLQ